MSCLSLSISVSVELLLLLAPPAPPPPPSAAWVLPVPDELVVEPVLELLELVLAVPLLLLEACDELVVVAIADVAGVEAVACVVAALLLTESVFCICMVG
jgi:hypothetical protein